MNDLILVVCERMGTFKRLIQPLLLPQYFSLLPTGLDLPFLSSRASLRFWWDSFTPTYKKVK